MENYLRALACAVAALCVLASCGGDNADVVPEVVNGTTNWFEVKFAKDGKGRFYYEGQHLTAAEMGGEVYGQGWQPVATYPIGGNGYLRGKAADDLTGGGAHLRMAYFNPSGTRLTYYYNGGWGSERPFYSSFEGRYTEQGWYEAVSPEGVYQYDTQVLDIWTKDSDAPTPMMAALVHLYSTVTRQGKFEHYGVRFYQRMPRQEVTRIMNEQHFDGDDEMAE